MVSSKENLEIFFCWKGIKSMSQTQWIILFENTCSKQTITYHYQIKLHLCSKKFPAKKTALSL